MAEEPKPKPRGRPTTTENEKEKSGIMNWWNNQGKGVKVGSLVGLCCLGLIIFGLISGMGSPDQTTSSSDIDTSSTTPETTEASKTPKNVTISELYGSSVPEGTYVQVTGTVIESDGFSLRIENSDGKDILIEGFDLDAYEDQQVTVLGTFYGPSSYTTVMGGTRTIPSITEGKIV